MCTKVETNMVENHIGFCQFLIDLDLYLIKFDYEKKIKEKNYSQRYEIWKKIWQLIIFIINNIYIF